MNRPTYVIRQTSFESAMLRCHVPGLLCGSSERATRSSNVVRSMEEDWKEYRLVSGTRIHRSPFKKDQFVKITGRAMRAKAIHAAPLSTGQNRTFARHRCRYKECRTASSPGIARFRMTAPLRSQGCQASFARQVPWRDWSVPLTVVQCAQTSVRITLRIMSREEVGQSLQGRVRFL